MVIAVVLLCSVILPIFLSVYALVKRQSLPLILGAIAFTVSQMFLRIPLLNMLAKNSMEYHTFQLTNPILFLAVIALSAGIFEETARYIAMRVFMQQKEGKAAIYFGIGHGGIEALMLVGIPFLMHLSTALIATSEVTMYLGAVERVIAMSIHICFSIIVFYSVKNRKPFYLLLTIVLHGLTNFIVVFIASQFSMFVAEFAIAVMAALLIALSIYLMRGMYHNEK